tara:strand:- start:2610 stop:3659 length:1050 start_codon:yes stop_codon:yes gene_type:complete
MINLYRKLKKIIVLQSPDTLFKNLNQNEQSEPEEPNFKIENFGKLNSDKTFYVIKRTPGTGFFSNLTFILNHLLISEKHGYIPIIDMENYKTIYNEKIRVKNTFNAWEYYFEKLNNFELTEVYKSKNVIITSNKFYRNFYYNFLENKKLKKFFTQKIKIRNKFIKIYEKIYSNLKDKKTLGIHFRGTSYKRTPGHPFPPTKDQILICVKKIIEKEKIEKIFLATEELDYLEFFKKKFPNNLIYIGSSYRSNRNDAFKLYPRNLHRYKLGREILLETMLLSRCDIFLYSNSNVSKAVIGFNFNSNQKRYEMDNGFNTKNIFISQILWYLKKILPHSLGGFKKDVINWKIY